MRFSILIPVYNVELYLQQCLDSVVNQSFHDYEVIIVDDGSTDNSGKICDEYAQRYPEKITVIHKQNQGLISSRRAAIEKAQGELCIFVDSDDFISLNLLETVDKYINKDEQIDIVMYSLLYYCGGVKKEFPRKIAKDSTVWYGDAKNELYELLVTGTDIDSLCTKAINTNLVKNDPICYEKYYDKNMSEDVLQSIYPLTFAQKIIYADIPLYYYRYNMESISRNFSSQSILKKDSSHVFQEIHKILPKWQLRDEDMANRINARWFTDVMYIFYKSCEIVRTKGEWEEIVGTDWLSMMPIVDIKTFEKYVGRQYIYIYDCYVNKKYSKVKIYFKKKKLYNLCRQIKRKVIKGK